VAAQRSDCAASASAAPHPIGAERCTQRKATRHLRRVHDGKPRRAVLEFDLTLIPAGIVLSRTLRLMGALSPEPACAAVRAERLGLR
jgi:hypothetical protein